MVFFVNTLLIVLIILILSMFFVDMGAPVERTYFQKFIKSKLRATVRSISNMLFEVVGIIALPLVGLSIDYFGARYTILLSAFLMIPSVIILLKIKDEENKKKNA